MTVLRPLNALPFLGMTVLTVLAAFALILAMPDNRYLRFQQLDDTIHYHARWIYERLHYDPTPVDVALVGTSRILWHLNAPLMEKRLAADGVANVHVANLALSESGIDLAAMLEREAIRTKHPQLIVTVAQEAFPPGTHPAFKELADISDLVHAPLLNRHYFENLMRGAYRQFKLAVVAVAPVFFGYDDHFRAERYAGPEIDTTSDERVVDGHAIAHHAVTVFKVIEAQRKRLPPPHRYHFGGHLMRYQRANSYAAYENMVRYAGEGRARLIILYEPIYKGPARPVEDAFLRSLAPVVYADWSDDDPRMFMDVGHRNVTGARLQSIKLADIIAGQLQPRPVSMTSH